MSLTLVKIFWFFGYFPVTRINDTGDKIFAGVIDTAEQFKNINSRISPRILEKIQNGPTGILGGLGDTDSWKKPEVENLVSDTSSREIVSLKFI